MAVTVGDPTRLLRSVARLAEGAGDAVTGTIRRRLVDADVPQWPARLRTAVPLAEPPPGSGLRPIMGDPGPPLVGWTLHNLFDAEAFGRLQCERFGDLWWSGSFGSRLVHAGSPGAVEQLLVNRDEDFVSGPAWSHFIGPFFPNGLMLLDGEHHREDRRLMQQAFSRPRLAAYLARMQPVLREGLAHLADDGPVTIRVHPHLKRLTLDVANVVFMGLELTDAPADRRLRSELVRAFVATVRAATGVVRSFVPGTRWHRGRAGRRLLEDVFASRIDERRGADGDDLFSVLCNVRDDDGSQGFTDQQVVDHMVFLMMAAHDTSTITLSAMLHDLARHPEWQHRCRDEVDALGGARSAAGRGDDALTIEDLDTLTCLDLVMKESLRMLAPVPAVFRSAARDVDLQGHHLPSGTLVSVPIQAMHRDARLWERPQHFDPERFGPDRREDRAQAGTYLPFGLGMHKCIGMHFGRLEVLTALYELLRTTEVSCDDGYETTWDRTSLPVPVDGLPLTLSPR